MCVASAALTGRVRFASTRGWRRDAERFLGLLIAMWRDASWLWLTGSEAAADNRAALDASWAGPKALPSTANTTTADAASVATAIHPIRGRTTHGLRQRPNRSMATGTCPGGAWTNCSIAAAPSPQKSSAVAGLVAPPSSTAAVVARDPIGASSSIGPNQSRGKRMTLSSPSSSRGPRLLSWSSIAGICRPFCSRLGGCVVAGEYSNT